MKLNLQITDLLEMWQELLETHTEEETAEIISKEYMKSLNTPADIIADISKQTEYTLIELLNLDMHSLDPSERDYIESLYSEGLLVGSIDASAGDYTIKGERLIEKIKQEVVNLHYEKLPKSHHAEADATIFQKLESSPYVNFSESTLRTIGNHNPKPKKAGPKISKYGIMKDATTEAILKEPKEIINQNAYIWGADQANKSDKSKGIKIPTYITMAYSPTEGDDNVTIRGSWKITAFDLAVCSAIASIYHYQRELAGEPGTLVLNPSDIWIALNGGNYKITYPTEHQIEEVDKSVRKLSNIKINIDIAEELNKKYINFTDDELLTFNDDEDFIVLTRKEFKTKKGRNSIKYMIYKEPLFYSYNRMKGRILKVDPSLLITNTHVGNEGYTIAFRNYLLLQIHLMYEGKRASHKIKFETIYGYTQIERPESRIDRSKYKGDNAEKNYKDAIRRARMNDRKKIMGLLDSWVEKEHIQNYSYKKGDDGITIYLNGEKIPKEQEQYLAKLR